VAIVPAASVAEMLVFGPNEALSLWWGYPALQLMYAFLLMAMLNVSGGGRKQWRFLWSPPWIGYLPAHMASPNRMIRLHVQLSVIGFCIIAAAYPWCSLVIWLNLVLLHVYILLPRLILLFSLRHDKPALLKINRDSTSLYEP
jgi:hypothetical protein